MWLSQQNSVKIIIPRGRVAPMLNLKNAGTNAGMAALKGCLEMLLHGEGSKFLRTDLQVPEEFTVHLRERTR